MCILYHQRTLSEATFSCQATLFGSQSFIGTSRFNSLVQLRSMTRLLVPAEPEWAFKRKLSSARTAKEPVPAKESYSV